MTVIPTSAATVANAVTVSAAEYDNSTANNTNSTSVAVSGSAYAAAPVLTAVTPSLLKAGVAAASIAVAGSNFNAATTVKWNGTDLPTTFVDASHLTATVDATLVASLGWSNITVNTPAPGGGVSNGLPITIYSAITLDTNDILFDPFSRKLWASIPSTATQVTGNSIVSIDPLTGAIGTPIFIGSEPTHLALSDDGQYLYVVLSGSKEVRRMDMTTLTAGTRFTTTGYLGTYAAGDLAVMPGNHDAVAASGYADGVQVWDINGSTATSRGPAFSIYAGNFLGWTDATHLYSYDSGLSPSKLHRFSVASNSVTELDETNVSGFGGPFLNSNGTLYSGAGGVVNTLPTPPQLLGRFNASGEIAIDAGSGEAFILTNGNYYLPSYATGTITSFNMSSYLLVDSLAAGSVAPSGSTFASLRRWGQDGLAFRTLAQTYNSTVGTGQINLLRGPFVLPQAAITNPTPAAATLNPASVSAGAANTYIVVSGSGFVPGAVASWNGSARTTVFVDASTLRVAVPASDFTAAGTATITVSNPNSSASSALTFTIN
jgi:hypothetical protein